MFCLPSNNNLSKFARRYITNIQVLTKHTHNMKKTLLSIAAITASLNAAVAQNGITELPDADHNGLMITVMSPNGKYVAGSNSSTYGGFIFNLENDQMVNFDVNAAEDENVDVDLQIKAIANSGLAVGWNGPASTFDFSTQKCTTYGATDQYLFNGISPSGGYIVGARYDGDQPEGTPCVFQNGSPLDLPLPSNSFLGYESAGAAALSVADNGTISGYFVDDMATRPATTWALLNDGATFFPYPISRPYFAPTAESTKPYAMFSCDQTTMSPNGKWLVINYEKYVGDGSVIGTARYNLQTDEVEFFTPNEEDERFAEVGAEVYGFGIADDGTVVGFYGGAYGPRIGFLWKAGETDIQRLATAFPGATRLADYDEGYFNTPSAISADGRYIAGFAYISPEDQDEDEYYLSWVLDTQDPDAAGSSTAVAPIVVKDKDNVAKIKALYSVDGARRNSLSKGINILRMSDGKSLKKLVK